MYDLYLFVEGNVKFNKLVSDVTIKNNKLHVSSQDGETQVFDCVILTMPVPQILGLNGTINSIIGKVKTPSTIE